MVIPNHNTTSEQKQIEQYHIDAQNLAKAFVVDLLAKSKLGGDSNNLVMDRVLTSLELTIAMLLSALKNPSVTRHIISGMEDRVVEYTEKFVELNATSTQH